MDVSKVRLRVKKADGDDLKPAPEPRTRERRKAEVSEYADSSVGPINLSIKKSGKTHFDGESAKKPVSELLKDKLCERRAEKRAAPRNEGKETGSKKARVKETLPSVERQDGKKDKEAKKTEKVVKPAEKVSKGRVKKEEKAAKERKETVAKNQDGPEEVKRADLQKKQQNQRMEKEMRTKELKQKEEEERRVRKRQEDERLEREKKEKEQKQSKEEEREWQEKDRIERETRETELKQKEQEERARVEKEKREKEKKEEEERRERERLEREKRASELKQEEERKEREVREWELKQQEEEEERRKKEMLLKERKLEEKEVGPVQAFKKAPARKASKKQKGTVKRDELTSPNHEEGQPKVVKRKAESAKEEKPKRKKVKVTNRPRTSKNTPGEVKSSKGSGRLSRKTNRSAVGTEVPSMCMETDKAAKALELSPEPEKSQRSPVQDQTSAEKPSHTSEELRVTKKPALEDEVRRVKATGERKATEEARTSSDIDSGTDSPTLDLSKPPCSRSQEGEDDEGIHSHDGGSDISDCASEVSYDSGLNGKLPETPTEELPSPTQLLSHTCVFCDRTFPLEMDYRRHLNRHLVNVYYLDTAAQRNK